MGKLIEQEGGRAERRKSGKEEERKGGRAERRKSGKEEGRLPTPLCPIFQQLLRRDIPRSSCHIRYISPR